MDFFPRDFAMVHLKSIAKSLGILQWFFAISKKSLGKKVIATFMRFHGKLNLHYKILPYSLFSKPYWNYNINCIFIGVNTIVPFLVKNVWKHRINKKNWIKIGEEMAKLAWMMNRFHELFQYLFFPLHTYKKCRCLCQLPYFDWLFMVFKKRVKKKFKNNQCRIVSL